MLSILICMQYYLIKSASNILNEASLQNKLKRDKANSRIMVVISNCPWCVMICLVPPSHLYYTYRDYQFYIEFNAWLKTNTEKLSAKRNRTAVCN